MKTTTKIILFLLLGTTLLCVSCGSKDPSAGTKQTTPDTSGLRKMSDTVIGKMQAIVSDDNYQTLTGTPEEVKKVLKEWSGYSPDTSSDILVIPVTEKLIPSYEIEDFNMDSLSGPAREYFNRHITSSITSLMNSTYTGTAALAAGSVTRYSETFRIDTDTFHDQVWILPCTDKVGITVEFANTGDEVITVCASYCTLPEPDSREQLISLLFGASSFEEIGAYYLTS